MQFTNTPRWPGRSLRPVWLVAAMALLASLFTALSAPAGADNAPAYRYWGYYTLSEGDWSFAQVGSGEAQPQDGDVDGWRHAVAGATDVRTPRAVLTFEEICGAAEASEGQKRVGVVVDYGREADAPEGEQPPEPMADCAVVDEAATGTEALLAVVEEVRQEGGMVCGIGGYPAQGCGGEVGEVSEEAAAADEPITITVAGEAPQATDGGTEGTDNTTEPAGDDGTEQAAAETDTGNEEETGTESEDTGLAIGTIVGVFLLVLIAGVAIAFAVQRRRRG